ncbi:MAG TPA: hypothetical protein VGN70_06475 [Gammaproteobacteria bacterium]|jgi:hypothetical protein
MYGRIASAALALLASGAAQGGTVEYGTAVPFRPCDGAICIQVTLSDHKPHTFLLDTSYNHSSISENVARALGWKLTPYKSQNQVVAGLFLTDGPKPAEFAGAQGSADFLAMSPDQMGVLAKYTGTLDYTFFKDRVLQIDYKRHLIRVSQLLRPDEHPKPGKGVLKLVDFHDWGPPIVVGGPFTVDGKSLEAQIDTSYTGSLLIFSGAEKSFGFEKATEHAIVRNFPITDGGVDMLGVQVDSTGFAGTVLSHPATVYFPTIKVHQPYQERFQGTVGNEFFAGTLLTLDFHDMTLDVSPAE